MSQSVLTQSRAKRIEARLTRVQAVAGGLFFVFLLLHLSNTLLAAFGADTYNSFQRAVRVFYQHPLLELLLVVFPLISHVTAGVWLYVIRKKRRANRGLKFRLQTWAGFFLVLTVFGHVLATRGVSFWYGTFPEFAGVSFSLWWVPGYFYPYYFLLFMAGLYHGTMGAGMLLRRAGLVRSSASRRTNSDLLFVGAVVATISLLAFGGKLFEIDDPRDNDYARQYAEFFDIDLGPGATGATGATERTEAAGVKRGQKN